MSREHADRERVLVIKPSSFGDIIHTLPAVAALKETCPQWDMHWLANEEWTPLLTGNPDLEEVIPFPRNQFRGLGGLLRARHWAREILGPRNFDRILDFQGLLRSALLAKACGSGRVIGFAQARECASFFYDEKLSLPDWSKRHAVDRNLELARYLGADIENENAHRFSLPEGDAVQDISPGQPLIVLHPFSRGEGKSLTGLEITEFCQALADAGDERRIVLVGGDSWQSDSLPSNTINLLGQTTLDQLIWILRLADVVVSVDSGPMHLAAALTDKLISIHTWTDPAVVGPWSKEAWFWRDGQLLPLGDIQAGQLPERRNSRKLIEQLRQQTGRLLPEGTMAQLAAAVGSEGVFRS